MVCVPCPDFLDKILALWPYATKNISRGIRPGRRLRLHFRDRYLIHTDVREATRLNNHFQTYLTEMILPDFSSRGRHATALSLLASRKQIKKKTFT